MRSMLTMIHVFEMSRSIEFYRDKLGLKLRFESPDWSEFDVGGSTLALHGGARQRSGYPAGELLAGTATIGLSVDHLDASYAEMLQRGVPFVMAPSDRADEGIRLALIQDPDGLVRRCGWRHPVLP